MTFGDMLLELRTQRGWSQVYTADLLDCTHSYISRLERNERNPRRPIVDRITDAFALTEEQAREVRRLAGFVETDHHVVTRPVLAEIDGLLDHPALPEPVAVGIRQQLRSIAKTLDAVVTERRSA